MYLPIQCNEFVVSNEERYPSVTDYLFGVRDRSEGTDQDYYVDWFELNVMGITPGKGRVYDVGCFFRVQVGQPG